MTAVFVVAGLVALATFAVLPFLLPWPQHLRWIVSSTACDQWATGPLLGLNEVTILAAVSEGAGVVWISGTSEASSEILVLSQPTPADLARLARWEAAGMPLLKVTHHDGEVSLHGPACSVGGLRPVTHVAIPAPA
jgi:hypothetical protein